MTLCCWTTTECSMAATPSRVTVSMLWRGSRVVGSLWRATRNRSPTISWTSWSTRRWSEMLRILKHRPAEQRVWCRAHSPNQDHGAKENEIWLSWSMLEIVESYMPDNWFSLHTLHYIFMFDHRTCAHRWSSNSFVCSLPSDAIVGCPTGPFLRDIPR